MKNIESFHILHRHEKKRVNLHLFTIYIFTLVLLTAQVAIIYYFSIKLNFLNANLTSKLTEIEDDILLNEIQNTNTIKQLTSEISTLESSFRTELSNKISASPDFSAVIDDAIKSVVTIETDRAQGTGFFITNDGFIITNSHILFGGRYARIITYEKKEYFAKLVGYNLTLDLALLKINSTSEKIDLGDSDNIRLGEKVIAIGNPLGLSFTVTEGIVSGIDRASPNNNLSSYIQTDVSLNPGNSGGPLINRDGNVVGINNFKISGTEGLGFALESNSIKEFIDDTTDEILGRSII
ncbi:trypsin-like peptidase domain-containing protein [Candidatus Pacearchaeota archaeon]|nr:trypsin-like peptidase domain-containing protein [Candidatus Pacearchaeota archaeon]